MLLFVLAAAWGVLGSLPAAAQKGTTLFTEHNMAPSLPSSLGLSPSVPSRAGVGSSENTRLLSDSAVPQEPHTSEVRPTRWRRVALGVAIGAASGAVAGGIRGHQQDTKCTGSYCDGAVADAVKFGLLGGLLGGVIADAWPGGGRKSMSVLRVIQPGRFVALRIVFR